MSTSPTVMMIKMEQICGKLHAISKLLTRTGDILQSFLYYAHANRKKPVGPKNKVGILHPLCVAHLQKVLYHSWSAFYQELDNTHFWEDIDWVLLASWPRKRADSHIYNFHTQHQRGARVPFAVTLAEVQQCMLSVHWLINHFYRKASKIQWWKKWIILWSLCQAYSVFVLWVSDKLGDCLMLARD